MTTPFRTAWHRSLWRPSGECGLRPRSTGSRFQQKRPRSCCRRRDEPVGPHQQAMDQVSNATGIFASVVSWLMRNHGGLSIHPNTTNPKRDHLIDPIWIGRALAAKGNVIVEVRSSDVGPIAVRVTPTSLS
ncbi:DOPA 4,5-dioxygenase family protein [Mesorhizobium sp.]|uniref:DOPA 4,5-dioxygenase family protein n=1 Tax=Mesorhizobium sp. TaxID=1871066 RepID=UPI0025DED3B8|nr:DOPA 4,5-dioxygenase family protein [Mesorhizobium sp.]